MMDITTDVVRAFRTVQPAFSDVVKWPDSVVTMALCEGDVETGSRGWGGYVDECRNFKQRGVFYYTAHWLATTYITPAGATDPTDISPTARLNVAAKSVGDESVTFRVGGIQKTEDDWLSLTNYGVQYLRLRKRAAMGARAV